MEKDFKKEYSEHMKSETPDLWARIEGGLTEKKPASKIHKFQVRKWMKVMPAAAAVLLLVAVAPVFMPKGAFESMEKSAMDMAMFDGKADNAAPEYEFVAEDTVEEGIEVEEAMPETVMAKTETDAEAKKEMPVESAGGTLPDTTTSNTTSGVDELKTIEIKLLHFQVLEQTQDMNLLAIDKEHIGPVCDLYLIVVDGEEKVLAIPMEEEVEFELGMWYDLTVTDSTEYGIDYIWVK